MSKGHAYIARVPVRELRIESDEPIVEAHSERSCTGTRTWSFCYKVASNALALACWPASEIARSSMALALGLSPCLAEISPR